LEQVRGARGTERGVGASGVGVNEIAYLIKRVVAPCGRSGCTGSAGERPGEAQGRAGQGSLLVLGVRLRPENVRVGDVRLEMEMRVP